VNRIEIIFGESECTTNSIKALKHEFAITRKTVL